MEGYRTRSMVWHEYPVTLSSSRVCNHFLAGVWIFAQCKQILSKVSLLLGAVLVCRDLPFWWGTSENGMFLYTKYFGWRSYLAVCCEKFLLGYIWKNMPRGVFGGGSRLFLYNLRRSKRD
jgi:hypothetical protein